MNAATMKYDVQTAGVRISFLVVDGEMSLEMPGGSFDDIDKTEPGVCRFPQTPANLRRLANMLNAMADLHERAREKELIRETIKEIYKDPATGSSPSSSLFLETETCDL